MPFSAGLDWGSTGHAICVVDEKGAVALRLEITHDVAGFADLRKKLGRLASAKDIPIAIERPSGLIVDALVEAGHPVVPIHPNVVKACRPRYRAAGGKSDPGDAYMLADILRTDGHRFRSLEPCSDAIKALRALVRGRDDLVIQRGAMANRLRSLLESFWPGAAAIFADVHSPIALAFVQRYPTPESAACLGEKRLRAFLARHSYPNRRTPAELLARLRSAPTGLAGKAEAEAKGKMAQALATVLATLVTEIAEISDHIEQAVADMDDGRIIMSFPRAGRICAAQILAELGDVRDSFLTADQLAAEAGVCPVTHASGKSRGVIFRWACNHRLRTAVTCFADNSRHASPWAADVYKRARERGCDHPHAIRILARAWIRILWRAWKDGKEYDQTLHSAAISLNQALAA
ncbi:MAG TPA: IS110 family transposase [Rhodospirillaceae bacterium]|nr:IS110 family transposase [Rhodospirillaceae bacterium]